METVTLEVPYEFGLVWPGELCRIALPDGLRSARVVGIGPGPREFVFEVFPLPAPDWGCDANGSPV